MFVVNFNDDYVLDLDKDFTERHPKISSRPSSASIRAVAPPSTWTRWSGSLDHLKKGHKDKRVLLVITDGEDQDSTRLPNTHCMPLSNPPR